jgi:eukaryotic-like serine/threonine-protein kinase
MSEIVDRLAAALADQYRLDRELGRGGMATVYLARDLKHDRLVALKVLHPELAAALGPERFLREIRTAARLQHPHILTVLDSGEASGLLWYSMPYVEGESLRERLAREHCLPVEDALRIAREVSLALDYAHRHEVVHRDVKPENVLLSDGQALLADFGVARAVAAGGGRLTETGLAVGTPAYMSPEQATGAHEVDGRSDIYALGCVLYEMLAGEPPYTGPTAQAMITRRLSEPAPPVRRARPAVSEAVERAVVKALAQMPADRFQTAGELAQVLAAAQVTDQGTASTPTASPASAPPAAAARSRRRPTVPSALAFVLGLLVTATMGMLLWRRSHRSGEPAGADAAANAAVAPSVAILYLQNLSADSSDAYLGDGLTEEITSRLSQSQRLRVKSRGAVRRFRDTAPEDPTAIGRMLGVDYLLEGSTRRVGDRVRVSVGLVKAADGFQVWGEDYDRPLTDVLAVQAEIAGQVVTTIAGKLAPEERAALTKRPTESPTAYDHYLRGQYYLGRRSLASVRRAIAEYQAALDLDPRFAAAQAKIGYAYGLWDDYGWKSADLPADSVLPRAIAASARAVALDSTSSDVWVTRGYVLRRRYSEDSLPAQLVAYQRALALDSTNVEGYQRLGVLLAWNLEEDSAGLVTLKRGLRLDPVRAPLLEAIGRTYMLERRCPESILWSDSALAVDSSLFTARWTRARCRLQLGDTAGAVRDRRAALRLPDAPSRMELAFSEVAVASGDTAGLGRRVEATLRVFPTGESYRDMATTQRTEILTAVQTLVSLGQHERALMLLTRIGPPGMYWVRTPEFDPIRHDPRFQRLVRLAREAAQESGR